ncbi:MAG: hypothetical protein AAB907_04155, partial [Patescibacteria group bacterium]
WGQKTLLVQKKYYCLLAKPTRFINLHALAQGVLKWVQSKLVLNRWVLVLLMQTLLITRLSAAVRVQIF